MEFPNGFPSLGVPHDQVALFAFLSRLDSEEGQKVTSERRESDIAKLGDGERFQNLSVVGVANIDSVSLLDGNLRTVLFWIEQKEKEKGERKVRNRLIG